ncbi:MAG: O-antigen ligase family protein [Flavobacteriaceae bacterium]|nr:O-antigen ligase family protein [Flavobacteriaceae bacterium]
MLNKISDEFIIGLVFFTLPISIAANSISIVIFILFFTIKYKSFSLKNIFVFTLPIILFLIQIYSFFISTDKQEALNKFIPYLPFLIFPLGFSSILKNKKPIHLDKSLFYLVYGVFSILIYALIRTVIDIIFYNKRFDYGRGGELILNYTPHHVYLGVFILFSILLISYLFSKNKLGKKMLLIIPFLYLILFLLPSRSILLISFILFPIILFTFIRKQLSKKQLIIIFTLTIATIISCFILLDYTRHKITHAYYNLMNLEKEKTFNGVDDRKKIWKSSFELIKNKPIIGYGIGDAQKELNKIYKKNGFYKSNMNAHNQYLQFIMDYGLVFTLLILLLIMMLLLKLLKHKNYFYFISIFILLLVFLTESLLNRQLGIVFISLIFATSTYSLKIKKFETN